MSKARRRWRARESPSSRTCRRGRPSEARYDVSHKAAKTVGRGFVGKAAHRTSILSRSNATCTSRSAPPHPPPAAPPTTKLIGCAELRRRRGLFGVARDLPSSRNRRQRSRSAGSAAAKAASSSGPTNIGRLAATRRGAAGGAIGRDVLPVLLGRAQVGEQDIEVALPATRGAEAVDRDPAMLRQIRRRAGRTARRGVWPSQAARASRRSRGRESFVALALVWRIGHAEHRAFLGRAAAAEAEREPPGISASATATCSATSSAWCKLTQMTAVPRRICRVAQPDAARKAAEPACDRDAPCA